MGAANDRYANISDDLLSPASNAAAVAPSNSSVLPVASKRLWIGGAGSVALVTTGGATVTYSAVPAGTYLYVRAAQVLATGTTATNIVAEY
ncbi:MAG: hypothetical protein WA840_01000 [Caulobacteraceae bacterium]